MEIITSKTSVSIPAGQGGVKHDSCHTRRHTPQQQQQYNSTVSSSTRSSTKAPVGLALGYEGEPVGQPEHVSI